MRVVTRQDPAGRRTPRPHRQRPCGGPVTPAPVGRDRPGAAFAAGVWLAVAGLAAVKVLGWWPGLTWLGVLFPLWGLGLFVLAVLVLSVAAGLIVVACEAAAGRVRRRR